MGSEPVRSRPPTPGEARREARRDPDGAPELLTPTEAQHLLRVSRSWLYGAAKDGRIPSIRLGGPDGPLRFVKEDLARDARAPPQRCLAVVNEHVVLSSGPAHFNPTSCSETPAAPATTG